MSQATQAIVTKLVPDDDRAVTCLKLAQWPRMRLFGPWESEAAMWNECIAEHKGQYVVICDQWARPSQQHLTELVTLLDFGYGFVDMGDHKLIGFHPNLVCRIGRFDERIIRKSDEVWDMYLRMKESDIAAYRTHICPIDLHCHEYPWNSTDTYFESKWTLINGKYVRNKPDTVDDCESTSMFLPWSKSVILSADIPLMREALR